MGYDIAMTTIKLLSDSLTRRQLANLNSIFSSWVLLGKPRSFTMREKYLRADGYEIHSSGTVILSEKVFVVADEKGLWLCVKNHRRELQLVQLVTNYPLGYYWIGDLSESQWHNLDKQMDAKSVALV